MDEGRDEMQAGLGRRRWEGVPSEERSEHMAELGRKRWARVGKRNRRKWALGMVRARREKRGELWAVPVRHQARLRKPRKKRT